MSQPSRKQPVLAIVLAAIVLANAADATAQKVTNGSVTGTVMGVANGMLQVKGKHDGMQWIIKPQGTSQYLGTAPKEWLRPGMIVMVTSTFDNDGKATLPVMMIQAFTPRPGRVIGVMADPSGFVDPNDRNAPRSYILSGPIKAIEDGNLIITGGRKQFTVPMAEEAEVTVDLLGDLSWVKAGDAITSKVKYVRKGQGFGTEMMVTGKETLEPPPPAPLSKKELRAKARREKIAAAAAAKAAAAAESAGDDGDAATTEEATSEEAAGENEALQNPG